MVDLLLLAGILAAGIRLGMAIGLSAIGESAAERSGVFNIGIEGIMLSTKGCPIRPRSRVSTDTATSTRTRTDAEPSSI